MIWACAQTTLTQFDRKGDHFMLSPMHTRFIHDAYPDALITFTQRAYWHTPILSCDILGILPMIGILCPTPHFWPSLLQ